ncbi:MAG TPA: lactonase family protein [Pirellulales bacterium]|nr:lactonase family protein [Pirellulales bacterium]
MIRSLALGLAFALTVAVVHPAQTLAADGKGKVRVYIGSYSDAGHNGIHLAELDLANGKLTKLGGTSGVANPSFLAIHPTKRFLYSVCEVDESDGKHTGAIAAFAIDPSDGSLKLLNRQSSGGGGPCHVTVDKAGKNVLAANYGGGSVCCLPIDDEGRLAKASAFVQHHGKSSNPNRQEAPHAHSVNLDPANRFAFVADLGLDEVLVYRFGADKGSLVPNDHPAAKVKPGSGPRHFAFHPSGRFAYVINEMAMTITAFRYDDAKGVLSEVQTVSTLPEGTKGDNLSTAEVQAHPSGKFVYGSNRGHNTIACFSVDAETGRLTPIGHASSGGQTPRNFGIDPTGQYLLAANQDSDNILVLKIDAQTGKLTSTGNEIKVPKPVCVKFVVK